MTYREIHWRAADAYLKNFSAATQAKGGALVKIEIVVFDPVRLGYMLQDLATIQREQKAEAKAAGKPKAEEARKVKAPQAPRLLTYRGGE